MRSRRVWFHKARAVAWAVLGLVSFFMGWQNSVALVWGASVYANVVSDWTAGEAADDREIVERLRRIERQRGRGRSHWPRRLREQVKR